MCTPAAAPPSAARAAPNEAEDAPAPARRAALTALAADLANASSNDRAKVAMLADVVRDLANG